MHSNASQQVRTDPNGSKHVRKLRKPRENIQKSRENVQKLREIFEKKIKFFLKKKFDEFFFPECIRMYPNVSECVKTGPNGPENVKKTVRKRRKTSRKWGRWHGGAVNLRVRD